VEEPSRSLRRNARKSGSGSMKRRDLVLDSWAVIALIEDEPAAQKIEGLIAKAMKTAVDLLITAVNLGEVWYSLAKAYSPDAADRAVQQVASMGVKVLAADWDLTYQAAKFKARGGIADADCFAAALAFAREAELIAGDPEFKKLEADVKISWI
jgi:PIN domain nuclease of toxin-antitoxin system